MFKEIMTRINSRLPVENQAKDFNGNVVAVSKHSGRATGITSMLAANVPTAEVCLSSKHRDQNSVVGYNRATANKMVASQLKMLTKKRTASDSDEVSSDNGAEESSLSNGDSRQIILNINNYSSPVKANKKHRK